MQVYFIVCVFCEYVSYLAVEAPEKQNGIVSSERTSIYIYRKIYVTMALQHRALLLKEFLLFCCAFRSILKNDSSGLN